MSNKCYVLINEHGEYDDFTRTVIGVFSTEREAKDAIPKLIAFSESEWKRHEEWTKRKDEYLKRFTPSTVLAPSLSLPAGFTGYTQEQYEEAARAAGEEPPILAIAAGETYCIELFHLDAIEHGLEI